MFYYNHKTGIFDSMWSVECHHNECGNCKVKFTCYTSGILNSDPLIEEGFVPNILSIMVFGDLGMEHVFRIKLLTREERNKV